MKAPRLLLAAVLVTALLPTACFREEGDIPGVQGPGSETVGLKGVARTPEGAPVAHGKVVVRPASWFRDTSEKAAANGPGSETALANDGSYRIAPLPVDSYSVEIRGDNGQSALVFVRAQAGLAKAPDAVLKPVGGLTGTIRRGRASQGSVFLRIGGLDRLLYLAPDSTRFKFADLPAGRYVLQALSGDPALGTVQLRDVDVRSGESGDGGELVLDAFGSEDYAAWPRSRAVVMRISPLGANLAVGIADVPVLVRLDATTFPFDSAAAGGSDLRFADAAGRHLAFEIARWDAKAKDALIWVHVDSLRAGDDSQSISLLWGKAAAPGMGAGASVFPAAQGWRGAWHFDAMPQGLRWADASSAKNPLAGATADAASLHGSPLGGCAQFDGLTGLLSSTDSVRAPQTFTLSMWFLATGPGKLIGFEDSYLGRNTGPYDRHVWIDPDGSVHFGVYIADPPEGRGEFERLAVSKPGYADGAWHHMIATQDPVAGMALFLDGEAAAKNADAPHAEDISGFWILGGGTLRQWAPALQANTHLNGCVDDATVSDVARGADWIRFAHANQAPGSEVVSLRVP